MHLTSAAALVQVDAGAIFDGVATVDGRALQVDILHDPVCDGWQ